MGLLRVVSANGHLLYAETIRLISKGYGLYTNAEDVEVGPFEEDARMEVIMLPDSRW